MFVFTGMIIWIATQGCISPVCITLYVICSMSLVYFIYCCGCVEYSKTYWKACVTTNKNWRIYNREESARCKIKVTRIMSGAEAVSPSKKAASRASVITMPEVDAAHMPPVILAQPSAHDRVCRDDYVSITGSTTMIHQNSRSACGSPVYVGADLRHTGSVSLLMGEDYALEQWMSSPSQSSADVAVSESDSSVVGNCVKVEMKESREEQTQTDQECFNLQPSCCQKHNNSFTNQGFDDTKL